MQDSGFRAWLRGEDAFREWWFSLDATRMRNMSVLENGTTRVIRDWDEAYRGYTTLFEDVIFRESSNRGRVFELLRDTATRIDDVGGASGINVPLEVINELGPVRGVRHALPEASGGAQSITKITDTYFDYMLMNPVQYRRGFLAEMIRTNETKRLRRLFLDQGYELIPDMELDRVLGITGTKGSHYGPLRQTLHKRAKDAGYITEGYISDLVEHRVVQEIDNILYTWDQGSRLGMSGKAVFPFGRPWADMMGFWGREVLSRPMLRGWIGNRGKLGELAHAATDHLWINPKPLATVSRLANQDFSVEGIT